ncbi:30S ribosomal protein S21 [Burkholderia ambifaria]|uniref:30S ribosomal protein S21 n=1 Tax=Burkholderia ambifaria TaxID=152480 RepID=UPI002FE16082
MTTIVIKPNAPVDVAPRRFRRDIEKTGLIRELRSRTGYEKRTTQRTCNKASAVARQRLRAKRMLPPRKPY